MRVPFSFLVEQFANPEPIFRKIGDFLKRCDFTLGEDVGEFEKRYARYCGAKYAIGVGSGTDALFLAMKAAGVQAWGRSHHGAEQFHRYDGGDCSGWGAACLYRRWGRSCMRCDAIEAAVTKRTPGCYAGALGGLSGGHGRDLSGCAETRSTGHRRLLPGSGGENRGQTCRDVRLSGGLQPASHQAASCLG